MVPRDKGLPPKLEQKVKARLASQVNRPPLSQKAQTKARLHPKMRQKPDANLAQSCQESATERWVRNQQFVMPNNDLEALASLSALAERSPELDNFMHTGESVAIPGYPEPSSPVATPVTQNEETNQRQTPQRYVRFGSKFFSRFNNKIGRIRRTTSYKSRDNSSTSMGSNNLQIFNTPVSNFNCVSTDSEVLPSTPIGPPIGHSTLYPSAHVVFLKNHITNNTRPKDSNQIKMPISVSPTKDNELDNTTIGSTPMVIDVPTSSAPLESILEEVEVCTSSMEIEPIVEVLNKLQPRRIFACDKPNCSKTYLYKQHLNRHKEDHSRKKIPCTLCKVVLSSVANLNNHMKLHNLGMHYHCSSCNLVFKRRTVCTKHIASSGCQGRITHVHLTKENRNEYTVVQRGSMKQINKLMKVASRQPPQTSEFIFFLIFFFEALNRISFFLAIYADLSENLTNINHMLHNIQDNIQTVLLGLKI